MIKIAKPLNEIKKALPNPNKIHSKGNNKNAPIVTTKDVAIKYPAKIIRIT